MTSNEYKVKECDKCIYYKYENNICTIICLYVDNSTCSYLVQAFMLLINSMKSLLSNNIDKKDLREVEILSREAPTIVDVHGFGVVLIELISGHIVVYFRKTPLERLANIRLNGEYNYKELMRCLRLGIACSYSNPKLRPNKRQILPCIHKRRII
ncbi:transmembrane protein, putative [Medicago truncatula]|uniref:Transmembrane protein, putative n=1 Tax=Medicago truncatula TaxID=3880 RepID=G7J5C0_MEDTR|nr:transmembrane protein, putative [Medicago truncatula]